MTSAVERATRGMKLRKEEIAIEESITPEQMIMLEIDVSKDAL